MIPDRGLAALYKSLKTPIGSHLNDEMLSLIVDAELAGEKIEQLYQEQLAHIENCERCATNYSDLLLSMQGIFEEMAQTAEATNRITEIWNQILTVTAEYINNNFRLKFSTPLPQLGESKPTYKTINLRLLTKQQIPGSPLITLEAYLKRQTPLTCELTIQLNSQSDIPLENFQINIHYGKEKKTSMTNYQGIATFESIPIIDLDGLIILITRKD